MFWKSRGDSKRLWDLPFELIFQCRGLELLTHCSLLRRLITGTCFNRIERWMEAEGYKKEYVVLPDLLDTMEQE